MIDLRTEYKKVSIRTYKDIFKLWVPILLSTFLNIGYSVINTMWVGNLLGKDAITVITISFPINFILISLASGLTAGTTVLVSQFYGAKKNEMIKKVACCSFFIFTAISAVVSIFAIIFSKEILKIMSTPKEVFDMATIYLKIILIGYPIIFLFYVINSILTGVGNAKLPLKVLLVSTIINAMIDPILIKGFGVNGAALASLISQILTFIVFIIYLNRKYKILGEFKISLINYKTILSIIKIGFPNFISQVLLPISAMFITCFVSEFGINSIAAFGIAGRIDYMAIIPAVSMGTTVSILVGHSIGRKKLEEVTDIFKCAILINVSIAIIVSLIVLLFPDFFMSIFTKENSVKELGNQYLKIVGMGYSLFAISYVVNGVIIGAGKTVISMIISFLSLCVIRVPLAKLLSSTELKLQGIWVAMVISFAITTALSSVYYFSYKWKNNK